MSEHLLQLGEEATAQLVQDLAARLRVYSMAATERNLTSQERLEMRVLADAWLEAEMAQAAFVEARQFLDFLGRLNGN